MTETATVLQSIDVAEVRRRLDTEREWLLRMRERLQRTAAATGAMNESSRPGSDVTARLHTITRAEARLENGTFGICTFCHNPISLLRMVAIPTVELCRRCSDLLEARP